MAEPITLTLAYAVARGKLPLEELKDKPKDIREQKDKKARR